MLRQHAGQVKTSFINRDDEKDQQGLQKLPQPPLQHKKQQLQPYRKQVAASVSKVDDEKEDDETSIIKDLKGEIQNLSQVEEEHMPKHVDYHNQKLLNKFMNTGSVIFRGFQEEA